MKSGTTLKKTAYNELTLPLIRVFLSIVVGTVLGFKFDPLGNKWLESRMSYLEAPLIMQNSQTRSNENTY